MTIQTTAESSTAIAANSRELSSGGFPQCPTVSQSAASGWRNWLPAGAERERHREMALDLWYRRAKT